MKQLELYINGEAGGYHTFILQIGVNREKLDFSSPDADAMYAEAARLIEADSLMNQQLRVLDGKRKLVKTGDMFVPLKSLKLWLRKETVAEID
ncbi:MAG: hypothetical protein K8F91_18640 [Candidatus Obscuribacterales bacterium]|nr:hypothetical protein [Candidatus Obscuribacterales bacterium]